MNRQTLPLKTKTIPYFYNKDKLVQLKEELETFLSGPGKYMNDRKVTEKFLGCQEIQSNNSIEGYNDDATLIKAVITDNYSHVLPKRRKTIIQNLYQGYQEILKGEEITPDSLKELYDILSNNLLCDYDKNHMGHYYREEEVFIHYSSNLLVPPDQGIEDNLIEEYMDSLFEYINLDDNIESLTDHYIKSQIMHYYFVYIHPYFDVNGRTSRTMSMWHLINNEAYPYVIFNRAIPLAKSKYYKSIRDVKKFHDLTYFLNFMMENVKIELEKEFVINTINDTLASPLSDAEYQTLQYILSMRGVKTGKDFASLYNRLNTKKTFSKIDETMLEPLIDKEIIKVTRYTKKGLNHKKNNYVFELNEDKIDNDPDKVKRLTIKKANI